MEYTALLLALRGAREGRELARDVGPRRHVGDLGGAPGRGLVDARAHAGLVSRPADLEQQRAGGVEEEALALGDRLDVALVHREMALALGPQRLDAPAPLGAAGETVDRGGRLLPGRVVGRLEPRAGRLAHARRRV